MRITLELDEALVRRYTRAARRARRGLASAAPTTEQLMSFALTDRAPSETAGEFILTQRKPRDWRRRRET